MFRQPTGYRSPISGCGKLALDGRRVYFMANERTYAILPCRDIDESIAFYETLGFKRTYRQVRPNQYAVVALEDIQIHLGGIEGFNPADSYGSVIIAVP